MEVGIKLKEQEEIHVGLPNQTTAYKKLNARTQNWSTFMISVAPNVFCVLRENIK